MYILEYAWDFVFVYFTVCLSSSACFLLFVLLCGFFVGYDFGLVCFGLFLLLLVCWLGSMNEPKVLHVYPEIP